MPKPNPFLSKNSEINSLRKKLEERKLKEIKESKDYSQKIRSNNFSYFKKLAYFMDIIYKTKFMEDKKISSLSSFIEDTIIQRNLVNSTFHNHKVLDKNIIKKFVKDKILDTRKGSLYVEIEKFAKKKNKKLDNSFFENLKTNEFEEIIINSIKKANKNY